MINFGTATSKIGSFEEIFDVCTSQKLRRELNFVECTT